MYVLLVHTYLFLLLYVIIYFVYVHMFMHALFYTNYVMHACKHVPYTPQTMYCLLVLSVIDRFSNLGISAQLSVNIAAVIENPYRVSTNI